MTINTGFSSVLALKQAAQTYEDTSAPYRQSHPISRKPARDFRRESCTSTSRISFLPARGVARLSKSVALLPYASPVGRRLKRAMDIFSSAALLVMLAPFLVMIAVMIYASMGRPVIFSHERVGFRGARFRCYKFRTMVNDADSHLGLHLANDPDALKEWQATHKLRNDPRVTRLGGALRKLSLDELPQLLNILKGDMACVGPRPVTVEELRKRYGPSARHYLKVRPGLTGLWQVSGRSNTSYRYRIALDRSYVMSWSVWLDLKILAKTPSVVFRFHESA